MMSFVAHTVNGEVSHSKSSSAASSANKQRHYTLFSPDTLKLWADSDGVMVSADVLVPLSQQATYQLRHLVTKAAQVMRHSSRQRMCVADVSAALKMSQSSLPVGHIPSIKQLEFLNNPTFYQPQDMPIFVPDEEIVCLESLIRPSTTGPQHSDYLNINLGTRNTACFLLPPEDTVEPSAVDLRYYSELCKMTLVHKRQAFTSFLSHLESADSCVLNQVLSRYVGYLLHLSKFQSHDPKVLLRVVRCLEFLLRNRSLELEHSSSLLMMCDVVLTLVGDNLPCGLFHPSCTLTITELAAHLLLPLLSRALFSLPTVERHLYSRLQDIQAHATSSLHVLSSVFYSLHLLNPEVTWPHVEPQLPNLKKKVDSFLTNCTKESYVDAQDGLNLSHNISMYCTKLCKMITPRVFTFRDCSQCQYRTSSHSHPLVPSAEQVREEISLDQHLRVLLSAHSAANDFSVTLTPSLLYTFFTTSAKPPDKDVSTVVSGEQDCHVSTGRKYLKRSGLQLLHDMMKVVEPQVVVDPDEAVSPASLEEQNPPVLEPAMPQLNAECSPLQSDLPLLPVDDIDKDSAPGMDPVGSFFNPDSDPASFFRSFSLPSTSFFSMDTPAPTTHFSFDNLLVPLTFQQMETDNGSECGTIPAQNEDAVSFLQETDVTNVSLIRDYSPISDKLSSPASSLPQLDPRSMWLNIVDPKDGSFVFENQKRVTPIVIHFMHFENSRSLRRRTPGLIFQGEESSFYKIFQQVKWDFKWGIGKRRASSSQRSADARNLRLASINSEGCSLEPPPVSQALSVSSHYDSLVPSSYLTHQL